MNTTDIVSGFRKALQDLLVPEIKALQTEVKHLNEKIDNVHGEMNKRFEQVDKRFELMDKRFEQVDKRFEQVDKRFENLHKDFLAMQLTQQKILDKIDVDKRITRLETLVEQLIKKAA